MTTLFPPFEPDGAEPKRRRFRPVPLRMLIPNVITLLSICSGLTAVRLAVEGKLKLAVIAVAIAAVLDGLDGRVARFLKGTSRFGAELDSLADFVNFGCAPALILYFWILRDIGATGTIGWIGALIFAVSMALRLARFNVSIDDPDRPDWQKNYFVGMPAPAGAMTSLLPVYAALAGLPKWTGEPYFVLAYTLFLAFLTSSTIPTFSFKRMGNFVPREHVMPLFVGVVLVVTLIVAYPFETLIALTFVYLGLIPLSIRRFRSLSRADLGSKLDDIAASDRQV
ncbi:MAG: phosphatidylcholine/phosphatidylserine synthase [Xanthobacteraceae bacterium]|nr:phosphatidylcholine/phosphatidylserine synthase [Xanthobacteraceae bacterium]